jgi:hypothetical protein
MATAEKHAKRSHYSSHAYKPFDDFGRRAYARTARRDQRSAFSKLKDLVASKLNKASTAFHKGDR